jgi:hypothetical protein
MSTDIITIVSLFGGAVLLSGIFTCSLGCCLSRRLAVLESRSMVIPPEGPFSLPPPQPLPPRQAPNIIPFYNLPISGQQYRHTIPFYPNPNNLPTAPSSLV